MTEVTESTTKPWYRDSRIPIVALGIMFLPTGLQAAFFPRSFHDDFPLGRGWIVGAGGTYDAHLVRDVGALFLALVIVSLWSWKSAALVRPVAIAWLVQGVLHLVYHVGHLDGLESIDKVLLIGSLGAAPVLAGAALALSRAE